MSGVLQIVQSCCTSLNKWIGKSLLAKLRCEVAFEKVLSETIESISTRVLALPGGIVVEPPRFCSFPEAPAKAQF